MASRDITEFFKPKLLKALKSAVSDDLISIATVERKEVRNQLKKVEDKKTGRSSYCKYTRTDRAEIGQYVAKSGVANAVQTFQQRFPAIKQQSISNFKRKYLELKSADPSESAIEIQAKKRGGTSLLPDELMTKTVDIIKALKLKAAPISYSVMAAVT